MTVSTGVYAGGEPTHFTPGDSTKAHNILVTPNATLVDDRTHEITVHDHPVVVYGYNIPNGTLILAENVTDSGLTSPFNIDGVEWSLVGGSRDQNVLNLPGVYRLIVPADAQGLVTIVHYKLPATFPTRGACFSNEDLFPELEHLGLDPFDGSPPSVPGALTHLLLET